MRNPGSAADLLPLLTVEEDHFLTTSGAMGRVLACSGLNLGDRERRDGRSPAPPSSPLHSTSCPADARLQFLAINRPLRAEDWVPRHLAQYQPTS